MTGATVAVPELGVLRDRRVLVIGAGRVGTAYAAACDAAGASTVVIDPLISQVPAAVRVVAPEVVVVATPPRPALAVAARAAAAGAVVLVAHPAALTPGQLGVVDEHQRVFVALEALFDREAAALLHAPVRVQRAALTVRAHRPAQAYQGWRARRDTAGGVLHQQALPGLALISRLLAPHPAPRSIDAVLRPRTGLDVEGGISATCRVGDVALTVAAYADLPVGTEPHVELVLQTADRDIEVSGPSWDAGLAHPAHIEHQHVLRQRMLAAAAAHVDGGQPHPSLFPIASLRPVLRTIIDLYRSARIHA